MSKTNSKSEKNETQSSCESPAVDLDQPGQASLLAKRIKVAIDDYCATAYDDGPRKHLGASLIGRECLRELWYTFRWCNHKKHDGRQQRLFNRGHREEDRFIEWLRGIGCTTWNETEDGKQFRVSGLCGGHFGGSLDGILQLPQSWNVNLAAFLSEFKTSGTGRKFSDLLQQGVKVTKPEHYAQMCIYGKAYQFKWALYLSINKNDDDLHVEIVPLDWSFATELERKAEVIVFSPTPPKKVSESKAYQACSFCDHKKICHEMEPVNRNCRSCKNARPIPDGMWHCDRWQSPIPAEHINYGTPACGDYEPVV